MKYEERKKQRDKMVDDAQRQWSDIIPKWDKLLVVSQSHVCHMCVTWLVCYSHNTKKVRELWWLGLPPGVRGTVWKKAIGNELNISHGEPTGQMCISIRMGFVKIYTRFV